MQVPPLVNYKTVDEYRQHFEKMYCLKPIMTFDGIPVYFNKDRFDDCMFESSDWKLKNKDIFSMARAERIDWIAETLKNPACDLYFGWDRGNRKIDYSSRIAVVYDEYVVVIRIKRKKTKIHKGEFSTAYIADNSIGKIRGMPRWKN
ncbi:hypothetical protein J7L05_10375 [bacterium]|nr:hypothetical protein [bacterium]